MANSSSSSSAFTHRKRRWNALAAASLSNDFAQTSSTFQSNVVAYSNAPGVSSSSYASATLSALGCRLSKAAAGCWRALPDGGPALGYSRASVENCSPSQVTDLERQKGSANVTSISDELDGILAEMGRRALTIRTDGQHVNIQLLACVARVIEVKLPKVDESASRIVQVQCRCNPDVHAIDNCGLREGLVPQQSFSVGVAQTERHAFEGGPYRFQSDNAPSHQLQFSVDVERFFLNLICNHVCHVTLVCRIAAGKKGMGSSAGFTTFNCSVRRASHESAISGDEDEEDPCEIAAEVGKACKAGIAVTTTTGRRLHAKLRSERRRPSRATDRHYGNECVSDVHRALQRITSPTSKRTNCQRNLGERIFGETCRQGAERTYSESMKAAANIVELWTGGNRRRACGRWVHKLSADCPRKMIRWLGKAVQDRRALISVAVIGAATFLWKRWRELHLSRARTGMRQLVWCKGMLAASRLRAMYFLTAAGRAKSQQFHKRGIEKTPRCLEVLSISSLRNVETDVREEPPGALHRNHRSSLRPGSMGFGVVDMCSAVRGFNTRPDEEPMAGSSGITPAVHQMMSIARKRQHPNASSAVTPRAGNEAHSRIDKPVMCQTIVAGLKFQRETKGESKTDRFKRKMLKESINKDHQRHVVYRKRYLLQFLDYPQDLPWLARLQAAMLVIQDARAFLVHQESKQLEAKLRNIIESRKEASKRLGAFAPLEAAMLSHPVITGLSAKLQRTTCSPNAWKGTLFDGCYGEASDRDVVGDSLRSAIPSGGVHAEVMRRLADLSGPFARHFRQSGVPQGESTSGEPCVATRTSSGYRIRAFGCGLEPTGQVVRHQDPLLELGTNTTPKNVRLDDLWMSSRSKTLDIGNRASSSERLLVHSEAKAQERYSDWIARSEENPSIGAVAFRRNVLPVFERLVRNTAEAADAKVSATPPPESSDKLRLATERVNEVVQKMEAFQAHFGDAQAVPPASREHRCRTGGSPAMFTQPAVAFPTTLEEVGRLVAESDPLSSILSIDQAVKGGFGMRCPAGWSSGYREEPMTEEELRLSRLLERQVHSNAGPAKRNF